MKENGIFVLNTQYGAEQIGGKLPKEMVHALIEKNARLYLIDAGKLAHGLGLGNRSARFGIVTVAAAISAIVIIIAVIVVAAAPAFLVWLKGFIGG